MILLEQYNNDFAQGFGKMKIDRRSLQGYFKSLNKNQMKLKQKLLKPIAKHDMKEVYVQARKEQNKKTVNKICL